MTHPVVDGFRSSWVPRHCRAVLAFFDDVLSRRRLSESWSFAFCRDDGSYCRLYLMVFDVDGISRYLDPSPLSRRRTILETSVLGVPRRRRRSTAAPKDGDSFPSTFIVGSCVQRQRSLMSTSNGSVLTSFFLVVRWRTTMCLVVGGFLEVRPLSCRETVLGTAHSAFLICGSSRS